MKPVSIACTDSKELQKIGAALSQELRVAGIDSPNKLGRLINKSAMVIVDYDFYKKYGQEFFQALFKNPHPPFLMLVPPEDTETIAESTEVGMRHIPKVPEYHRLLSLTVDNVLNQAQEQEELKQNVLSLKQRVKELEKAESKGIKVQTGEPHSETRPHKVESDVLDNIVLVFKRGEIELPTLPEMSLKFQNMVNKGANLQDIGELLKQDMAISSKLISVSNSALFRGVTESKNLGQAVGRLGLQNTKRYVDTICNKSLYVSKNKKILKHLEQLWEHSLACAYASQVLEEALAFQLENDAFTMGLLHDIGKLLLLRIVGEMQLKRKLGDHIKGSDLTETLSTYHGQFGAALLKKWKFSEDFAIIAAYHDSLEEADSISNDLMVVHFGNLMAKSMGFSMADMDGDQQEDIDLENAESARHLGLDASMIDELKNKVSGFMTELKGLFV